MKKYNKPKIEVVDVKIEDILLESVGIKDEILGWGGSVDDVLVHNGHHFGGIR